MRIKLQRISGKLVAVVPVNECPEPSFYQVASGAARQFETGRFVSYIGDRVMLLFGDGKIETYTPLQMFPSRQPLDWTEQLEFT